MSALRSKLKYVFTYVVFCLRKMSDNDDLLLELDLPLIHRLILRIPKLSLDGFSEKSKGYFWILGLPLFVAGEVLGILVLLTMIVFPYNMIAVFVSMSIAIAFILRILLEREINTRRALMQQGYKWDVERACEDYLSLLSADGDSRKTGNDRSNTENRS